MGKMVKVGVWEDDSFRGVIIFGRGANGNIGKPFGLDQTQVCELVRVALREHRVPVTRMVKVALIKLRQVAPTMRLVVSYADSGHGHHGGIYQGGNWMYLGPVPTDCFRIHGKLVHRRTIHAKYGRGGQAIPWLRNNIDPMAERVKQMPKHKYVMPLDRTMREQLMPHVLPYPQRAGSSTVERPASQQEGGGSNPTSALT